MPPPQMDSSEQAKNISEIVQRREFLNRIGMSFMLALSLNPLMALAYTPNIQKLSHEGYCITIEDVDEKKRASTRVVKAIVSISNNKGDKYKVHAWIVKHGNQTILQPSVAVLEEGSKGRVIGIGDDVEYIFGEVEVKPDPKEYLEIVKERAQKERKRKVVRAVDIIKRVYYDEEEKDEEISGAL